jgi:hypothetical protein
VEGDGSNVRWSEKTQKNKGASRMSAAALCSNPENEHHAYHTGIFVHLFCFVFVVAVQPDLPAYSPSTSYRILFFKTAYVLEGCR